jgi:hypothetical protein
MAATLLDLVRQRRIEMERAGHEAAPISDATRLAALMSIVGRAEQGDPGARATVARVRELFDRVKPSSAPMNEGCAALGGNSEPLSAKQLRLPLEF